MIVLHDSLLQFEVAGVRYDLTQSSLNQSGQNSQSYCSVVTLARCL